MSGTRTPETPKAAHGPAFFVLRGTCFWGKNKKRWLIYRKSGVFVVRRFVLQGFLGKKKKQNNKKKKQKKKKKKKKKKKTQWCLISRIPCCCFLVRG